MGALGDFLKGWVPQRTRHTDYDSGCACADCQARDRTLPELRVDAAEVLSTTSPTRTCGGYQNCCRCPECQAREQGPPRKPGTCPCPIKLPDPAGYCETCRRAVAGFFDAEREAA